MSHIVFPRREREPFAQEAPGGKVSAPAGLGVPREVPRSMGQYILLFVIVGLIGGVMYVLYTSGLMRYSFMPIMMVFTYGFMFFRMNNGAGNKKSPAEQDADRTVYFNQSDLAREELTESAEKQYLRAHRTHPDPDRLAEVVGSRAMWERRRNPSRDEFRDFGQVRLGLGTIRQAMNVEVASLPDEVAWVEPASGHAHKNFIKEQRYVRGMPRVVSLPSMKALSLVGPLDEVRELAYAAVCQLCVAHSPDDVKLMVVTARPELWEWVKWLPHAQDPSRRDGCGERRMVFTSAQEFENYHSAVLLDRGEWRPPGGAAARAAGDSPAQLWVVVDDACGSPGDWESAAPPGGFGDTCFIRLAERAGDGLGFTPDAIFELTAAEEPGKPSTVRKFDNAQPAPKTSGEAKKLPELPFYAYADRLSLEEAERIATAMSPYRPGDESDEDLQDGLAPGRTLLETLGIRDARVLDTEQLWADRWKPGPKFWRFPIGMDDEGNVLEMDLKESSQYGWNLNGIIVGHIGSGKSVGIACISMAMLLTHSPIMALFALFDLKAKSIAQVLEKAPNCVAAVSNLGTERHLIERMLLAIRGLFDRRAAALEAADCINITQYNTKIAEGEDWPIMPALAIVVDEFNELPGTGFADEFYELADLIVRQGRFVQIALILVGQQYDAARLRKIEKVFGWKIAMRTGTAETSRAVIDDPIAYHLPSKGQEGTGYLRVGADPLKKFRFFNVFEDYEPVVDIAESAALESDKFFTPREFTAVAAKDEDGNLAYPSREVQRAPVPQVKPEDLGPLPETQAEAMMEGVGDVRPLIDFWLPVLTEGLHADELVRRVREELGIVSASPGDGGKLRGKPWYEDYGNNPGLLLPIAQEDRPYECRQPVLAMDMNGRHYSITGGKQTGLTEAAMTAVLCGSMMYRPERLQFYCIAGGGSALMSVKDLPHVQGIALRNNLDGVVLVLDSVLEIMAERERLFAALELDAAMFVAARAADPNAYPEIPGGQIVLVIDGYVNLKEAFAADDPRVDRFVPKVVRIAREGLSLGVQLLITAGTNGQPFNLNVQNEITGRLELKLGQPTEAKNGGRKKNEALPNKPGWGLSVDEAGNVHRFLTGRPAMTNKAGQVVSGVAADYTEAFASLAGVRRKTAMAQLPPKITLDELRAKRINDADVVVALREKDLLPQVWNFRRTPHLVVLGAPGEGKTNFLRTVCRELMDHYAPGEIEFHVIDLRQSLIGATGGEDYTKSYSLTALDAREAMQTLVERMQERKPKKGTSGLQKLQGKSWNGPEVFVVIDNAELTPHTNAMEFPFAATKLGDDSIASLADQGAMLGLHVIYSAQLNSGYPVMSQMNPMMNKLRNMFSPTLVLNGDRTLPAVAANVRPRRQSGPGKGLWVEANDNPDTVLAAWTDDPNPGD